MMTNKYILSAIITFGFATLGFAQSRTPDFAFSLGKTNYYLILTQGSAKAKNDSTFYNLYRMGNSKRIGKEIKHIVNKATGDTIKSGSFETKENQIFFYVKEKNKPTMLRLYSQNSKGLLSVQSAVSTFVAPQAPKPKEPESPPYHNTGQPEAVEIQAEFPGGINKARQFIANNLRYPEEAQANEIEATVRVKFKIEKDGSISKIEIVNKSGYGLDEEVIRVIKRMPKWTPAKSKGKVVESYFTMPISFRLN